jgi:hypothetical protein
MKTVFSLFAFLVLALTVGIADFVSPAYAGVSCSDKPTKFNIGDKSNLESGTFLGKPWSRTAEDCSGTKNLNGRTGQAAALGAALDSRIANPGERINLDLNWMTNDIGGAGAVGGSAFFHVPELDDNLYIGLRGGFGFEGQGALVGVGASWAFSPF